MVTENCIWTVLLSTLWLLWTHKLLSDTHFFRSCGGRELRNQTRVSLYTCTACSCTACCSCTPICLHVLLPLLRFLKASDEGMQPQGNMKLTVYLCLLMPWPTWWKKRLWASLWLPAAHLIFATKALLFASLFSICMPQLMSGFRILRSEIWNRKSESWDLSYEIIDTPESSQIFAVSTLPPSLTAASVSNIFFSYFSVYSLFRKVFCQRLVQSCTARG